MTLKEELNKTIKESNDLLQDISNLVKIIQEDEMSLLDSVRNQMELIENLYRLKAKVDEILKIRFALELEDD